MSGCPYTWVRNLFGAKKTNSDVASALRVTVAKMGIVTVDVSLPAGSARWLIDLIPDDVMTKIREEKIPIDNIQEDLKIKDVLKPQKIFILTETEREVQVWLE